MPPQQALLIKKDNEIIVKRGFSGDNFSRYETRGDSSKKIQTEVNIEIFRDTLENLDKIKLFKFYFQHNNYDMIIPKLKRKKQYKSPSKKRKSAKNSEVNSANKFTLRLKVQTSK